MIVETSHYFPCVLLCVSHQERTILLSFLFISTEWKEIIFLRFGTFLSTWSLKPLNITHVFVYCTIKLFLDTGGENDCKISDRPHVICTPQVINTVRSRINRNPVRKQKKIMSWEMDIALRTMSWIIKQDLGLPAFKRQTGQCLTVD